MAEKLAKATPAKWPFSLAKLRSLCSVVFAIAFQASLCQSQADTVVNQNSVYTFDFTGGGGLTGWAVDGQNQVYNQWFYYRIGGAGGESPINAIGAAVTTYSSSGSFTNLTVGYTNSALSVSVSYQLGGNNPGSGKSGFLESISVWNYTATNMDLHFFDFSHYNIGGDTGNQTIRLGTSGTHPNSINQTNSVGTYLTETLISGAFPVNHAQVDTDGSIYTSLNDGSPTMFGSNNLGPAGPADVESAFEWDWTVSAGTSRLISTTGPSINPVPEPSALALIFLGVAAWGLRRKRQG